MNGVHKSAPFFCYFFEKNQQKSLQIRKKAVSLHSFFAGTTGSDEGNKVHWHFVNQAIAKNDRYKFEGKNNFYPLRIYREEHLAETVRASAEAERRKSRFDIQTFNYNEEFDPGSGWTLAAGLIHASRGAARRVAILAGGDRRTGA